jgi:hypothetical protein
MKVFYHKVDLDGWCSAAIIKQKYPEAELIPFTYGDDVPFVENEILYFVDISIPQEEFYRLSQRNNKIIWIDHHISAINNHKLWIENDFEFLTPVLNDKKAACELTWEYIYPDVEMPEPVRLLGLYDSFRHKGTPDEKRVLYFQYRARSFVNSPETIPVAWVFAGNKDENEHMKDIRHNIIEESIRNGKIIYEYLCMEAQSTYKNGYSVYFHHPHEEKFICFNVNRFNPINFGIDYHKDGYDGVMCFWWQDNCWNVSLYNDNGETDVSEIAKIHGGGGHKGAAGFKMTDISSFIFKK